MKLLGNLCGDARTLSTHHGHHLLYPLSVCLLPYDKQEQKCTDHIEACQASRETISGRPRAVLTSLVAYIIHSGTCT